MRRRQRLNLIAESIGRGFTTSVGPDIPNLLEGPDVLAGRDGELVAVFAPRAIEIGQPFRLLGRLVLSKLALPAHCAYVLVNDEDEGLTPNQLDRLTRNFDATADVGNPRRLRSLLREVSAARQNGSAEWSLREMVRIRAARLMDLTRRFSARPGSRSDEDSLFPSRRRLLHGQEQRRTPERRLGLPTPAPLEHRSDLSPGRSPELPSLAPVGEPMDVPELPARFRLIAELSKMGAFEPLQAARYLPSWRADVPGWFVRDVITNNGTAVAAPYDHPVAPAQLAPFFGASANLGYGLDHGALYQRHPVNGILGVLRVQPLVRDPEKHLRAAALAGWSVIENPSVDDVIEATREVAGWPH